VEAAIAKFLALPADRFTILALCSPLLVWGAASLSFAAGWIDLSGKSGFNNQEWATVVAVSTAIIAIVALLAGLFRAGWVMAIAVFVLSLGASLAFMMFDILSLIFPFVSWLGVLPAIAIVAVNETRKTVIE
jgi:uncharacterized Tic20 family protein